MFSAFEKFVLVACLAMAGTGIYRIQQKNKVPLYEQDCKWAKELEDWSWLEDAALAWTRWEPNNATPWLMLGEAYQNTGQKDKMIAALDNLPRDDPRSPHALMIRADALLKQNEPIKAEAASLEVLSLNPRVSLAYRRLTLYYAMTFQRRKMLGMVHQAIENDCDVAETYVYLIAQDWISFTNSHQFNTEWLGRHPENGLFRVARLLDPSAPKMIFDINKKGVEEDKQSSSEGLLREYVDLYPENLDLLAYHLTKGSLRGDVDFVEEILAKAPKASAKDSRFWRFAGWLHARRGEDKKAIESLKKALELNPFDWKSRHQLAGVYRRLQQRGHLRRLQDLVTEGKELQRDLMELPDIGQVSVGLLRRIARYAEHCGQSDIASKMDTRLGEK